MSRIKIKFTDFWTSFEERDEPFDALFCLIKDHFDIELSDKPDYVICSCFGSDYLNYPDAVRILFLGENIFPNFNFYDYAIGFHNIHFDDRYIRFPLYWLYQSDCLEALAKGKTPCQQDDLLNREFCGLVTSHVCNLRDGLFNAVMQYKHVSSGGPWLNNIGGTIGKTVGDKRNWQRKFKFSLCSENSITNGYVTEKILQGFSAHTVPIYLGTSSVVKDFNPKAFVNVSDFANYEEAIQHIAEIDQNDNLYLSMLAEPAFAEGNTKEKAENELIQFLSSIFEQNKQDAFRRNPDREWGVDLDIHNQERCLMIRQKYWRLKHLENTILQKEFNTNIYDQGVKQRIFNLLASFLMAK